jgi:electron transfer flavoprotein beta subunit
MKILVTVKRVVDYNVKIRIRPDGSGVETNNVKMSMNPFDEIAVEEAVRLKEKGIATETVAITFGVSLAQETLRTAMAMGIDRAIYVPFDGDLQSPAVAAALAAIVAQEKPDLIIMGKQAIDNDSSQTGPMLAALLGWPQATFASKLDINGQTARVTREIDGGMETLDLTLPAVVTTDLRLNEPRYASLPNIVKAKKKPIETLDPATLGVDFTPSIQTLSVTAPPVRQGGVKVADVATLVQKLREEAKVI